jgi:hypothetical protein
MGRSNSLSASTELCRSTNLNRYSPNYFRIGSHDVSRKEPGVETDWRLRMFKTLLTAGALFVLIGIADEGFHTLGQLMLG